MKGFITALGYILFVLGFLSILLSMVGLQLTPLKWMNSLGTTAALVLKVVMLFGGIIIMYVSRMPKEEE